MYLKEIARHLPVTLTYDSGHMEIDGNCTTSNIVRSEIFAGCSYVGSETYEHYIDEVLAKAGAVMDKN